jgi:NADH-quinone oxidoreductase subunit N
MISLVYYLRVVAAVWMRPAPAPAIAGGSPDADAERPPGTRCLMIVVPTILAAAATVAFGVYPDPLVDWASAAGESLAPPFL